MSCTEPGALGFPYRSEGSRRIAIDEDAHDQTEECGAFQKCGTNDHVRPDAPGDLRLACHTFQSRGADTTKAIASADDRQGCAEPRADAGARECVTGAGRLRHRGRRASQENEHGQADEFEHVHEKQHSCQCQGCPVDRAHLDATPLPHQCAGCSAIPMNSAVRNTQIYVCRNPTNSSSKLRAVTPSTLATVIPPHKSGRALPVITINARIIANTLCPANMLANRRTANTPLLITVPIISMPKIITWRIIPNAVPATNAKTCPVLGLLAGRSLPPEWLPWLACSWCPWPAAGWRQGLGTISMCGHIALK